MPQITPTVSVVGLTTSSGAVAAIVDGDEGAGWAPIATRLETLTDTFVKGDGTPNTGKPFACIEFDYGVAVRVPLFLVQLATEHTLGDCMLIGSDNPATTLTDVVDASAVLLGLYPRHELVAGAVLATAMKSSNISKRYIRMCFHSNVAQMTPDGTPSDDGGSSENSRWFDTGSGNFTVFDAFPGSPFFLDVEIWGGAASGGESGTAANGNDSSISFDFTVIIAGKGNKSGITTANTGGTPAIGGTASGGNIENTSGQAGGLPTPLSTAPGYSGEGGDAPHGGQGGGIVAGDTGSKTGIDGQKPGGGGSGRVVADPSGVLKYPGGAAGAYVKHRLTVSDSGDVIVGNDIGYVVGAGGVSSQPNGKGANGRVKFSWKLS